MGHLEVQPPQVSVSRTVKNFCRAEFVKKKNRKSCFWDLLPSWQKLRITIIYRCPCWRFFFFFDWQEADSIFFPVTCSSDGAAGGKKRKTMITAPSPRLDILPTADWRGVAPQEKMNIHQREKCLHVNECTCEMGKWRRAEAVRREGSGGGSYRRCQPT